MMCKTSPVSSAIAVFDTVKLLLIAGADVDVTTGYDDTCVHTETRATSTSSASLSKLELISMSDLQARQQHRSHMIKRYTPTEQLQVRAAQQAC
eukprot:1680-Heterococcus_DN1.PRE.6